jgi:hypothetical protein
LELIGLLREPKIKGRSEKVKGTYLIIVQIIWVDDLNSEITQLLFTDVE